MPAREHDPLYAVSTQVSDLYVALEDLREEPSNGNRLKILALFDDLRTAMDATEPTTTT